MEDNVFFIPWISLQLKGKKDGDVKLSKLRNILQKVATFCVKKGV